MLENDTCTALTSRMHALHTGFFNSVVPGASKFVFFFLLSQRLEMSDMSSKRLEECFLVIVSHTKLLACLNHNGGYLWIVNLTHPWEQVMSGLMVQSS